MSVCLSVCPPGPWPWRLSCASSPWYVSSLCLVGLVGPCGVCVCLSALPVSCRCGGAMWYVHTRSTWPHRTDIGRTYIQTYQKHMAHEEEQGRHRADRQTYKHDRMSVCPPVSCLSYFRGHVLLVCMHVLPSLCLVGVVGPCSPRGPLFVWGGNA